jgi:hypothetical protein
MDKQTISPMFDVKQEGDRKDREREREREERERSNGK